MPMIENNSHVYFSTISIDDILRDYIEKEMNVQVDRNQAVTHVLNLERDRVIGLRVPIKSKTVPLTTGDPGRQR